MLRRRIPVILSVITTALCQVVVAEGQMNDESVVTPLGGFAATRTISCNLLGVSGQCREYTVLSGATDTLSVIKEGCVSMGGTPGQAGCPDEALLAQCIDIVRNYKKPDAIYDAFYYASEKNGLSQQDIKRVCGDLGGEYISSSDN